MERIVVGRGPALDLLSTDRDRDDLSSTSRHRIERWRVGFRAADNLLIELGVPCVFPGSLELFVRDLPSQVQAPKGTAGVLVRALFRGNPLTLRVRDRNPGYVLVDLDQMAVRPAFT
jgi:hypothetical protein